MESVLAFLESNGLNDAANLARSRAQSTGRLSSSAEKARFVFVSAGQAPQIRYYIVDRFIYPLNSINYCVDAL